jgi:hypothetical protein
MVGWAEVVWCVGVRVSGSGVGGEKPHENDGEPVVILGHPGLLVRG